MKKNKFICFISILACCLVSTLTNAQAPQAIPYQAVVRDANGNIVSNQGVNLQFTIRDNFAVQIFYQETQIVYTNELGLLTANIGHGNPVVNTFSEIDWGNGLKFLNVQMDISGGSNFADMGTTTILSVPYALYAGASKGDLPPGNNTGNTLHWDGTSWANDSALYNDGNNIGIGTNSPDAKLHISGSGENVTTHYTNLLTGAGFMHGLHIGINGTSPFIMNSEESDLTFGTSGFTRMRIAPDGNVGIDAATPEFKLTLNNDGGILASGVLGAGADLSTAGNGTRLIWYPKKAAFRAGYVSGSEWDNNNIGERSFAAGSTVKASGYAAAAVGLFNIAEGDYSFIAGRNNLATGSGAVAMGRYSTASATSSVAIGESTSADGESAVALGYNASAGGNYSFSVGNNSDASGENAVAMGLHSTASGFEATAIGSNTNAIGNSSFATGYNCHAYGDVSIAMGNGSNASATYSTAIGNNCHAATDNSTAFGLSTTASGTGSTAFGENTTASAGGATAMGNAAAASAPSSTAMGFQTIANGYNATAMGQLSVAHGIASTAMGHSTQANGDESTAAGLNCVADGDHSVAMGSSANASGTTAIALGASTDASGTHSVAIGQNATATGNNTVAIGQNVIAWGNNSVALGSNISTDGFPGCFFIGDNSTTISAMGNTRPNHFGARFDDGYILFTTSAIGTSSSDFVYLLHGDASWSGVSDKRKKEEFKPINLEDLLQKVGSFQITSWKYKAQDPSHRHLGCMAQDFYNAFHLNGEGNDTTINSLDIDGVNMAAIQALKIRTDELKTKTDALKTATDKIDLLQTEIDEMKNLIAAILKNNAGVVVPKN